MKQRTGGVGRRVKQGEGKGRKGKGKQGNIIRRKIRERWQEREENESKNRIG